MTRGAAPIAHAHRHVGGKEKGREGVASGKAADESFSQRARYARQAEEKLNAGRYTLAEAAEWLEREVGERRKVMERKLSDDAKKGLLPVYEPGRKARYEYGIDKDAKEVRPYFEEAYWCDLNNWLAANEPRIEFRFPEPDSAQAQPKASRLGSVSGSGLRTLHAPDWAFWHAMRTASLFDAVTLSIGVCPHWLSDTLNRLPLHPALKDIKAKLMRRLKIAENRADEFFADGWGQAGAMLQPENMRRSLDVVLTDFGRGARGIWNDLPPEFPCASEQLPGPAAQLETEASQPSTNHAPAKAGITTHKLQAHSNDMRAAPKLTLPNKSDAWAKAIEATYETMVQESGGTPSGLEVWLRMNDNPPRAYPMRETNAFGSAALAMRGQKTLTRDGFMKRWERYTAAK